MKRLRAYQILDLNRRTINENGGQFIEPNNLLHPEQIDYICERVDAGMFDQEYYPTIADKAAFYLFSIISNHVFSDGNKRTGLTAALVFLGINGYELRNDLRLCEGETYDERLENFVLNVASGTMTLDECRTWFAENITEHLTPPENPE